MEPKIIKYGPLTEQFFFHYGGLSHWDDDLNTCDLGKAAIKAIGVIFVILVLLGMIATITGDMLAWVAAMIVMGQPMGIDGPGIILVAIITAVSVFLIGGVFIGGIRYAYKATARTVEETVAGAAFVSWRDKVCHPVKFIRKEK
jgi:cbb3-type cytochrome oxidase subunit 3